MLNAVNVTGNLVQTPELRHTTTDKSVTNFTLAVERDYVVKGEERKTDFVDVVAWDKTAEFVTANLSKGQKATVSGRLQSKIVDNDGLKHKVIELVAQHIYF